MFSEEIIIPLVAILAVFGPAFYLIYAGAKLIRYRIDRKYAHENSREVKQLREFMERTELRLQALEEIVSEDGVILEDAVAKAEKRISKPRKISADYLKENSAPESENTADPGSSKLRNQLKS